MQLTVNMSDTCVPLRVVYWMSLIVTCICLSCNCVLQQSLCCKCHAVNFNEIAMLITVGQFGLRCFRNCCLLFTLFVFYIVDCCNLARLAHWILFKDIMTVETIVWQKLVLTSWIIERLDRKLADVIGSNIVEKCDVTLSRAIQPLTSDVLRVFN